MPNHTDNIIRFLGPDEGLSAIQEFLRSDSDQTCLVDFNRLIPMPTRMRDMEYVPSNTPAEDDPLAWARKHWGTKWGAYSIDKDWTRRTLQRPYIDGDFTDPLDYIQIRFQTAWNKPDPIIEALGIISEQFNLYFDHWFSDEDGGSRFDPLMDDFTPIWEHNVRSVVDYV